MKKNRTSLILTLLLVLVSVYFLFFKDSFSTLGQKDNDFAVTDTGAITKVFIADKDNRTVTLTRVKGGEWMVNNKYNARNDAMNNLLYTIRMIAVKDIIDPNSFPNVIRGLASGGLKVEIYKGDKRIKMYYVGGPTADQLGTYMLLANYKTGENFKVPYIVYIPGFDGYLSTRYFIKQEDWRDRTIWQYYPYALRSVKVNYPASDSGFQINIMGHNKFSLQHLPSGQTITQFDTTAIKQYLTYFQSVSWEMTTESDKKDSILGSTPLAVIDVKDTTGKVTEVKLFNKNITAEQVQRYGIKYKYDPDLLFALVNGDNFVFVQYYIFGKMLQSVTYFSR